MKGRPKNNRQGQTHHWSCKKCGRVLRRSLEDRHNAIPTSLNIPPPKKDKNNNHKIQTR